MRNFLLEYYGNSRCTKILARNHARSKIYQCFHDKKKFLNVQILDPMVDTWPLMSSPGPLLAILAAYLMFVLKIGPKMMKDRPAYELKNLMIAYNAFQVIFSIWLSALVGKLSWHFLLKGLTHK